MFYPWTTFLENAMTSVSPSRNEDKKNENHRGRWLERRREDDTLPRAAPRPHQVALLMDEPGCHLIYGTSRAFALSIARASKCTSIESQGTRLRDLLASSGWRNEVFARLLST